MQQQQQQQLQNSHSFYVFQEKKKQNTFFLWDFYKHYFRHKTKSQKKQKIKHRENVNDDAWTKIVVAIYCSWMNTPADGTILF